MLIHPLTCSICQGALAEQDMQCPHCHCVIQFTVHPPVFSRSSLVGTLVQPVLEANRTQVVASPHSGLAQYLLGLCYVNYELLDQGVAALQQAASLLPEKHRIRFELAVLHSATGHYATGLEQISLAQKLVPDDPEYKYLSYYLTGMVAETRHEPRTAVTNWLYAYQLLPDAAPAATVLRQFITAYADKLNQPIARHLRGLAPQDTENLRVLNGDPALQRTVNPKAPRKPGQLGSISLGLLRRLSPTRATAVELLHSERLGVYQQASEAYASAYQGAMEQRESSISTWQAQTQTLQSDLPSMARLCLAVAEEEERLRIEEARRRAEIERRRQESEQRRRVEQQRKAQVAAQSNTLTPVAPPRQKVVREKQYFSAKAQYIRGLPKGKEKDAVTLTVSNLSIVIKHGGMLGAWEHSFPTASLAEATVENVKHLLSSEKHLRLSYLDERGMLIHTTLAQLNAEDAVKQILKARADK